MAANWLPFSSLSPFMLPSRIAADDGPQPPAAESANYCTPCYRVPGPSGAFSFLNDTDFGAAGGGAEPEREQSVNLTVVNEYERWA
ncbi:hypothetical protein BC827DRAFT_1217456 [Russula dissimulans]|nr:hypothetical protein BC827DRAFT_1217456 [Russula dissimulans]